MTPNSETMPSPTMSANPSAYQEENASNTAAAAPQRSRKSRPRARQASSAQPQNSRTERVFAAKICADRSPSNGAMASFVRTAAPMGNLL